MINIERDGIRRSPTSHGTRVVFIFLYNGSYSHPRSIFRIIDGVKPSIRYHSILCQVYRLSSFNHLSHFKSISHEFGGKFFCPRSLRISLLKLLLFHWFNSGRFWSFFRLYPFLNCLSLVIERFYMLQSVQVHFQLDVMESVVNSWVRRPLQSQVLLG